MKFLNFSLLFILIIILTGCFSKNIETSKIKIGITLYRADDTFISSIKEIIVKEAREQESKDNIKITLNITDAAGQQTVQNEQVDTFISQGYDVICVNMMDRTAAAVIIDKAKAANIPVIFFNREPVAEDLERWEKVYYVGAKAEQSGKLQGKIIYDLVKKKSQKVDKNNDGIIQYVMLEGELGHQDALLRTEYSIRTLNSFGIKVEKLANDSAAWRRSLAKEKMSKWLDDFGDAIEVVLANNDDMALGAIDAAKEFGYDFTENNKIIIIGIDATTASIESIKNNEMYATVLNNEYKQGKAIFELAYSIIKQGKAITSIEGFDGKYLLVDYISVTKENVFDIKK